MHHSTKGIVLAALTACSSPLPIEPDASTLDASIADASSVDASSVDAEISEGLVRIEVHADGTFHPAGVRIRSGTEVEWVFEDRRASVIPATYEGTAVGCPAPLPYEPSRANEHTGPLPRHASGVFVLSGLGAGENAITDATWEDPSISGVFLRLMWNEIAIAPGDGEESFDFRVLDALIDRALASGMLYSLGIKAGNDGTPDWIFSTDPDGTARPDGGGGVERLALQDSGEDLASCGARMFLGTPTDARYQEHYFNVLRAVSRHIRERADRYRALAYIKPSGANLFSHENRLPKRCDAGCVCNTQVLAEAGYTPSGLYEFYRRQLELFEEELPGTPISYGLIQDGFPSINDAGDYQMEDGTSSGEALITGIDQTEAILAMGAEEQGMLFVVQHNGLGQRPPSGTCPNEGMHPALPPYAPPGPCPNRWVLRAGAMGQVTGFQTSNAEHVATNADLESTFSNQFDNSDGIFLEIYERSAELAREGVLDETATGRTLDEWAEVLHERRRAMFPDLVDPYPATFRFRFEAASRETLHYVNGLGCDPTSPNVGTIVIEP